MILRCRLILLASFVALAASQGPTVDEKLETALIRYTWFSSAAYSYNCRIPPFNTTIEQEFSHFITDSQATLFRDDEAQEFILAFRGTSSLWDILTDFLNILRDCSKALGDSCANCKCHHGFLRQYLGMQDQMTTYLTSVLQETGYKLTVTGHSMGAAGASMYAAVLRSRNFTLNAYTYGQPRTGNQEYADFVDAMFPPSPELRETNNIYRVTNRNDGIPQVPHAHEGLYQHHSTEIWIPTDGRRAVICSGQEPNACNQAHHGFPLNAAHFSYFGVSTGNPFAKNAACKGHNP